MENRKIKIFKRKMFILFLSPRVLCRPRMKPISFWVEQLMRTLATVRPYKAVKKLKTGLVLLILPWQLDMLWKASEWQIKLVVWTVGHVQSTSQSQWDCSQGLYYFEAMWDKISRKVLCQTGRSRGRGCVLLFLLCGCQGVTDALVRVNSSEHKKRGQGQRKHRRKWQDRKIEHVINLEMKARWE